MTQQLEEPRVAARGPLLAADADRKAKRQVGPAGFERYAAIGFWAAGLVLLFGTAVDLSILWVFQRQDAPTWEFVAISNTLEAFPRLVLGFGLLYPALHFQRGLTVGSVRTLSTMLVLLGVAAAVLGVLEVTDYFVLQRQASPQTLPVLKSTTLKAATLGGAFFVILTTLGVLGWRRPRS